MGKYDGAVDWGSLSADQQKSLAKSHPELRAELRKPRQQTSIDEIRGGAIRALNQIATFSQSDRARVLKKALEMNNV